MTSKQLLGQLLLKTASTGLPSWISTKPVFPANYKFETTPLSNLPTKAQVTSSRSAPKVNNTFNYEPVLQKMENAANLGYNPSRNTWKAHKDFLGKPTIGPGLLMSSYKLDPSKEYPASQVQGLFKDTLEKTREGYRKINPLFDTLSRREQAALVDAKYNTGTYYKDALSAMLSGDVKEVYKQLPTHVTSKGVKAVNGPRYNNYMKWLNEQYQSVLDGKPLASNQSSSDSYQA